MKSGEFWLNCLDDDVSEKWLNNFVPKDYLEYYSKKEMTFGYFISSITWINTPEGVDYWLKLYNTNEIKLIRNNKLKQLGLLQKQSGTL